MDIITTVSAALGTVSSAISIARTINDADKELSQAELKLKMAEIMTGLAEAKIALGETKTALSEKDNEIYALREKLKTKANMVQSGVLYYICNEDGSPIGLPHCSRCFEMEGLAITVSCTEALHTMQCPQCKSKYPSQRKMP